MKKIVFATNNKHKLQEVKAILAGKADVLSSFVAIEEAIKLNKHLVKI